jgi:hypothetical protein
MTPADLARAIHDRHCAAAARNRPSTSWSDLTPFQRDQLEDEARRLQSAYASGCDAPSRGMR